MPFRQSNDNNKLLVSFVYYGIILHYHEQDSRSDKIEATAKAKAKLFEYAHFVHMCDKVYSVTQTK